MTCDISSGEEGGGYLSEQLGALPEPPQQT